MGIDPKSFSPSAENRKCPYLRFDEKAANGLEKIEGPSFFTIFMSMSVHDPQMRSSFTVLRKTLL
jgi:hypothetical protein